LPTTNYKRRIERKILLSASSHDVAVISAEYAGLTLGKTLTAIANRTAVTKQFGASPEAFIIVP